MATPLLLHLLHRIYSVRVEVRPPGAHNTTVLQYNTTVRYITPLPGGGAVVQIERSDARVGDAPAADNPATELAQACGAAPYPLQLAITAAGRIAGIHNIGDIAKRWEATATYLRRYFAGELAHEYIRQTEATLLNPEKLKAALSLDLFLGVYFSAQYRLSAVGPHNLRVAYPALPGILPLVYSVQASVAQIADAGRVEIKCTGASEAAQALQAIYAGGEALPVIKHGTMTLRYELGARSALLHGAEGFWETAIAERTYATGIRISLLEDAAGRGVPEGRKSVLSF